MSITSRTGLAGLATALLLVGCSPTPNVNSAPNSSTNSPNDAGSPTGVSQPTEDPGVVTEGDRPPLTDTPPSPIQPNVAFEVTTESGTCPDTVEMWEFTLGYEGGADHTVVVDFPAIAFQSAQIAQSEDLRVIYEAPLQEIYASCVGTAQSDRWSMYAFQFVDGKVRFDLNLTQVDGYMDIRYTDVSSGRPYVYWQAAE